MASEFVTMTSPTKVYPVIQITLYMQSCDQSLVTLAFYTDLTRGTTFFERWSWFKLTNLGLTLGMTLKFYTSVTKRVKTNIRKVLWAKSYVCSSYRGKTGRGCLFAPTPTPILNRVKVGMCA